MNATDRQFPKEEATFNIPALKFILWLIIISIIMLFAGLTSAYIVRKAEGNWLTFQLPDTFILSSIIIILSSLTMHYAYRAGHLLKFHTEQKFLWITLLLGILFMISQLYAWFRLVDEQVFLIGNPSGSFLYVISGAHLIHIIGGVGLLVNCLLKNHKRTPHLKHMLCLEQASTFWHFLGILWIYLYIFFLFNH